MIPPATMMPLKLPSAKEPVDEDPDELAVVSGVLVVVVVVVVL